MLRSVINWLKKRKIAVLLLIFTFIISGLIVNLVQLLTLPLYWINKKLFRQMNAIIVYFHWCSESFFSLITRQWVMLSKNSLKVSVLSGTSEQQPSWGVGILVLIKRLVLVTYPVNVPL